MSTIVMSVNAGSSSLKFQVFKMPEEEVLASGNLERIGIEDGIFGMKTATEEIKETLDIPDHAAAVEILMKGLIEHGVVQDLADIKAMGHRVVHGGEYFSESVAVDEWSESKVEELCALAPLHNPGALVGLRSFRKALPDCKHTFVFDTAFHQSMPAENYIFPLPYEYYTEDKVRRYGAHGTSHEYLTKRLAQLQGKKQEEMNIITCHLGNGASITAVKNGKSFKTSMGFTPLGGIMMGTRCGDIDPAIVPFLQNKHGYTPDEMDTIMNKKSGMLGVSGISSDGRDIANAVEEGNERAILTINVYVSRIVEMVSGYYGLLGGADAIVFAGGIGENDCAMRQRICDGLKDAFGVVVKPEDNDGVRGVEKCLSAPESKMQVWLIPTNEELVIARDAYRILQNA